MRIIVIELEATSCIFYVYNKINRRQFHFRRSYVDLYVLVQRYLVVAGELIFNLMLHSNDEIILLALF